MFGHSKRLKAPKPFSPFAVEPVEAAGEPEEAARIGAALPAEPAEKSSWFRRLRAGLAKTSSSLGGVFASAKVDEALFEELETALLSADAGVGASDFLLQALRKQARSERLNESQAVKTALRGLLIDLLKPLERSLALDRAKPCVILVAGANGVGKTTSIGKLTRYLQRNGRSALLAAGDTFRAAAHEQLAIWGEQSRSPVVAQAGGEPAAVIFDALNAAQARKFDVLIADTAGRLPTQRPLIEELKKIKRVLGNKMSGAPHETILVIDANSGQNALAQVKAFDDALALTGLIVTKLDGTAKGGILAAIARERPVPVYFIGAGEQADDLQPFRAAEFAAALLG